MCPDLLRLNLPEPRRRQQQFHVAARFRRRNRGRVAPDLQNMGQVMRPIRAGRVEPGEQSFGQDFVRVKGGGAMCIDHA